MAGGADDAPELSEESLEFPDICATACREKNGIQNAQNIITITADLFVCDGFIVQLEKSSLSHKKPESKQLTSYVDSVLYPSDAGNEDKSFIMWLIMQPAACYAHGQERGICNSSPNDR